jgi:hypothetical protein
MQLTYTLCFAPTAEWSCSRALSAIMHGYPRAAASFEWDGIQKMSQFRDELAAQMSTDLLSSFFLAFFCLRFILVAIALYTLIHTKLWRNCG